MIDKEFWKKVAERWTTEDDGINIPIIDGSLIELINPEDANKDSGMDDEIMDILSDLGIDDDL